MKRTYITKDELKSLLNIIKRDKKYDFYIIIKCLTELNVGYKVLEKMTWDKLAIALSDRKDLYNELVEFRDIANSKRKSYKVNHIVQISNRYFNEKIKEYQRYAGISRSVNISSKIFGSRIYLESGEVHGVIEYVKKNKLAEPPKNNFLYVVRHKHRDDMINALLKDKKIGITNDLNHRIKGLTLGPVEIECLKVWKIDFSFIHKVEKILHKKFEDRKIIGEWFEDMDNNIVQEIEKEIMLLRLLEIDIEEIDNDKLII
jgi:hypothetical protein